MSPRPYRRFGNNRPRPRPGGRGRPHTSNNQQGGAATAVLAPKEKQPIELPAIISVGELADVLSLPPSQVIKALIGNGIFATQNQEIDYDTAAVVAGDLGFEIREKSALPEAESGDGKAADGEDEEVDP